jgi:pimeloyl-ACP methyl ester carboxylesterase
MLVDHNQFTHAAVIAGKYVVGYAGLGAFFYFLLALFIGGVPAIAFPFSIAVEVYGAIEILWYLLWFLPYKSYLQRPGTRMAEMTRAERKALIEKSLDLVPDVRLFLRKWFNNAHLDEIYRDDVKDWLVWVLWGTDTHDGCDAEELNEYVDAAESRANLKLHKGRAGAKPIRLNLDPVHMIHRSLLFYGLISLVDTAALLFLILKGFSFYRQPRSTFFKVFPFRPATLLSFNKSASPQFSYIYRRHMSKKHRPIVFFHGIGIGLPTYSYWLQTIPKDIGVLAIEFLPVSSRICPGAVSQRDFVEAMRKILYQQDITDFVFVAHSYGTFSARPLLDDPVIGPMINSLVLCDPVSILVHLPDVAYNITRRKPMDAPQLQIAWGAALDPMVAHTVSRTLHWPEVILFRENLIGKRTTAIVASRDCVLNPDAVSSYVYYGDVNYTSDDIRELRNTPGQWTGQAEIELMYLYNRDHGQSLLIPAEAKKITNCVLSYATLELTPVFEVSEEPPVLTEEKGVYQEPAVSRFSEMSQ